MYVSHRQQQLLQLLIDQYIHTAEPVSSQVLADHLHISAATVRNEMAELTHSGFIRAPYTSAGRIPTEIGYRYYVEHCMTGADIPDDEKNTLNEVFERDEKRAVLKNSAKCLSTMSRQMVMIAFDKNDIYCTGISYLFLQPEANNRDFISSVSIMVDEIETYVGRIFDTIDRETVLLLGSENPFYADGAALLKKYRDDEKEGLIGILGSMRMEYSRNMEYLNYWQRFYSSHFSYDT
ncbi:MAG: HTH domain-containing protein [Parcubacteria group bacterium]|nr:HTH domain-containing protein [Parcubacteria group bacterium]